MTTTSPQIRADIEQLLTEAFAAVDHGHATASLQTVTEDFAMTHGTRRIARPEYDALMVARESAANPTRHVMGNVRVEAHGSQAWKVEYVVVVHRSDAETGEYSSNIADFADLWIAADGGTYALRERSITSVMDMPRSSVVSPEEQAR